MKQVSTRGREWVGFWTVSHIHFGCGLVFFQAWTTLYNTETYHSNWQWKLVREIQTSKLIKVQDTTFPSSKDLEHSLIQATTVTPLLYPSNNQDLDHKFKSGRKIHITFSRLWIQPTTHTHHSSLLYNFNFDLLIPEYCEAL